MGYVVSKARSRLQETRSWLRIERGPGMISVIVIAMNEKSCQRLLNHTTPAASGSRVPR